MNEKSQTPRAKTKGAPKEQVTEVVRQLGKSIGTYSRFDPTNPKDRGILCIIPGCGKYNHRRKYCATHPIAEVMPFLERAAGVGTP